MKRSTKAALVAAPIALALTAGALADFAIKDGNAVLKTVKSFVCETTKICYAHVLIRSDGMEVGTVGQPLRVDTTATTDQPVKLKDGNGNVITSALRGTERAITAQIRSEERRVGK